MIKPLVILFNALSVFVFSFFFGDSPVSVTGNIPKNIKPGTEFTAEIKITKGAIAGFAKFQIEVPQGFTVKELDNKGGSFSFANNIGKIIWTSSPSESEFTVKFTIMPDASTSGVKTISSKFSYVNNNVKEVVEMTPAEITIGDAIVSSETSTPTQTVQPITSAETNTVADAANRLTTAGGSTEPSSAVNSIRTITKGATDNEYNVQVKIKKPGIKGFAKYQEILPIGFTMKAGATNGSSFSVSDGKGKFVWVSLPAEDELTISYTLERGASGSPTASLDGEFSYLENDQTKKVKLTIDPLPSSNAVVATNVVTNNTVNTNTVTENTTKTDVVVDNANTTKTDVVPDNTIKTNVSEPVATVTKKQGNIAYHVQIGAFNNPIESAVLAKKFNVSESITSEMAEGFHKFMIGNFGEYKEARNNRETVKQKGCQSAFVVAYNGAKRITVQEALMITSQKWYK